jgi:hypothetical protein
MLGLRPFSISCALLLFGGCGKSLSQDECNNLLDHYVELLVRSDRPGTSASELLELERQARLKAEGDPAFKQCSARVSRGAFECAMAASNADKLEQCLL